MQERKSPPSPLTDDDALRAAGVALGSTHGGATAGPRLDSRIRGMLASFRWRIRLYIWLQGIALALAWLGIAFWLTLGLDWWVEPPAIVRQLMLAAAGLGLVHVLWRFIARRLLVSISSADLAVLLERRYKRFGDSLLTTVELSEHPDHASEFNAQMLANTQSQAMKELPHARIGAVFNRGPLWRGLLAATVGVGTVVAFAVFASGALKVWADRNLMFSDRAWPRRTHLELVGFENKKIKIAKGSDLNIVVRADTNGDVPQSVQLRYRTDEGRSRENMARVGVAEVGDPYQEFAYTFRGLLTSRTFDVVGGDAALRGYEIEVVDVPTIEMALHFEYPKYTRREPADRRVSGSMEAPQGTTVTVEAKANKDLVEAPVAALVGDKIQPLDTIRFGDRSDPRRFRYRIDNLDEDRTLLFTLVDTDGIRSREPIRLILRATPDEPPRVGVHLRGISSSITPQARLPIDGEISDDYGLAKLWFDYKMNESEPTQVALRTAPKSHSSLKFDRATDEALDFKDRKLAIGQQISLEIGAEDNCALKSGANRAFSEKFQLAVVEPDQLLTLLEARELQMRMRLEAIMQDLTTTRDQLADVRFTPANSPPPKKDALPKAGAAAEPTKGTPAKLVAAKSGEKIADKNGPKLAPGEEPDDVKTAHPPGAEPGDTGEKGPGLRSPQVVAEQTLANSERGASETISLADAFDDIRDEMANNRIDTPELEYRLKEQIAEPLRRIGSTMFPDLDRRLRRLQAMLSDPQAAKPHHADAVKQIDAILVEMRGVLNKMLELESFNEIVEHLRDIINTQEKLNKLTQKKQKENALKLED